MSPTFVRKTSVAVAVLVAGVCVMAVVTRTSAASPRSATAAQKSVGRGWPVPVPLKPFDGYPEDDFVGAVTPWYYTTSATATGGQAPAGVQPLARDIFTSKDFYATAICGWTSGTTAATARSRSTPSGATTRADPRALENGNPATAAWGHCDRDYPREAIVSPYPFKTAQRALRSVTRRDQGARRTDGAHEGHLARLERPLHEEPESRVRSRDDEAARAIRCRRSSQSRRSGLSGGRIRCRRSSRCSHPSTRSGSCSRCTTRPTATRRSSR